MNLREHEERDRSLQRRRVLAAILTLWLILIIAGVVLWASQAPSAATGLLRVTFIDVGQGDAAWLRTPDGSDILIDGGDKGQGPGLVSYLKGHGVTDIEVLILTHPHADHFEGLITVLEKMDVYQALTNCQDDDPGTRYQIFLDRLASEGLTPTCVRDVYTSTWGTDISVVAVNPPEPLMSGTGSRNSDLNNNSIVLRISFGSVDFLFAGDIEGHAEKAILDRDRNLEAEVLKVAHHGSDTSSDPSFLSQVDPEFAIISVGSNDYGHPSTDVIKQLQDAGATVCRTDEEGTIVATTDGTTYSVQCGPSHTYLPLVLKAWSAGQTPADVRVNVDCCQFEAPGTEEYVCFTNWGGTPQSMTDWRVRDEVDHTYSFPPFVLGAGATVKLHTGSGTDTATDLYWGRGSAVWNNEGDTVYLFDSAWNLVDSYSY